MTTSRAAIDVSELPPHRFDAHAPIWWGNVLMIVIETTMFGTLVASYFYLKQNFREWPPPRTEPPSWLDPLPDVWTGATCLALLLLSCVPMYLADRAARRESESTKLWTLLALAFGAAAIGVRFFEFGGMHVRWDANAYGSVVWTVLGFHLFHLASTFLETLAVEVRFLVKGVDMKHAVDLSVGAVYWYWMVGIWIPIFVILYFAPRWL